MDEETPMWVGDYGESTSTGIVGIYEDGYQAIIMTEFFP
jgi:hypothetical protein